ncbi:polysaccharide lyase [Xylogone sp. PMI_703]|nr:polysaccharide lyase [Xylogone sp. PMI_703]
MFSKAISTAALLAFGLVAEASQSFSNTGTTSGWSAQTLEDKGTIEQVTNVVYKGTTALKFTQTYDANWSGRFHSEKAKTGVYKLGDQGFYGFAFRLQDDWQSSPAQSYNIAQFIADFTDTGCDDWMPSSMVWLVGNQLYSRVKYGSICSQQIRTFANVATISAGVWHTVTIQASWKSDNTGFYKLWLDGDKVIEEYNLPTMINDGRPFDFHVGIYANGWHDDGGMKGSQPFRQIWFDQISVGTTFADANPSAW